jgi:hypothetical protein
MRFKVGDNIIVNNGTDTYWGRIIETTSIEYTVSWGHYGTDILTHPCVWLEEHYVLDVYKNRNERLSELLS